MGHHFHLPVLALLGAIASTPIGAQSTAGMSPADSAGVDSAGRTAHRELVRALVAEDSAAGQRWWCADYRATAPGSSREYGREAVLDQFGRKAGVFALLRALDTAALQVTILSDSQVTTRRAYLLGRSAGKDTLSRPIVLYHTFHRRPEGWCAASGRTLFIETRPMRQQRVSPPRDAPIDEHRFTFPRRPR